MMIRPVKSMVYFVLFSVAVEISSSIFSLYHSLD